MPLEASPGDFLKLISEFTGMITINPQIGFIQAEHLTGNWKLIGVEAYPNKMTAINKSAGIFVKFYPPQTGDYAQKSFQAIQELAQIEGLPYPILVPEAMVNGALVFKAGEYMADVVLESLNNRVQTQMTEIVSRNGLTPLTQFDKMALVKVDGIKYLVDPIDDSVYSISLYCK